MGLPVYAQRFIVKGDQLNRHGRPDTGSKATWLKGELYSPHLLVDAGAVINKRAFHLWDQWADLAAEREKDFDCEHSNRDHLLELLGWEGANQYEWKDHVGAVIKYKSFYIQAKLWQELTRNADFLDALSNDYRYQRDCEWIERRNHNLPPGKRLTRHNPNTHRLGYPAGSEGVWLIPCSIVPVLQSALFSLSKP